MSQYNKIKWRIWRAFIQMGLAPRRELQNLPSDGALMDHIQKLNVRPEIFWQILEGIEKFSPAIEKTDRLNEHELREAAELLCDEDRRLSLGVAMELIQRHEAVDAARQAVRSKR